MALSKAKPSSRLEGLIESSESWVFYLLVGVALNQIIWTTSFIYLKFKSPAYTSTWAIAVGEVKSSTNIRGCMKSIK